LRWSVVEIEARSRELKGRQTGNGVRSTRSAKDEYKIAPVRWVDSEGDKANGPRKYGMVFLADLL
jgi:hypothetical protein